MEQDFKREARKQYFKYFRIWFIILGVLLAIAVAVTAVRVLTSGRERANNQAPAERVYDYADVLTEEEETALREYIAVCEAEVNVDIVLVTICEDMEASGYSWETSMMNYADDFYDHNNYGYNKVHGDGVLLLDNWYEGQKGSWLSTCGSVYEWFGDYEINRVLDDVYYEVDDNPYGAYRAYVRRVTQFMEESGVSVGIPWILVLLAPIIVAVVFALTHLSQKAAKDTTTAETYVAGGKPEFKERRDDFIRKSVVTRHIDRSSGSSGGRSSGRGGSHRSSSGVSHGGGGRRR